MTRIYIIKNKINDKVYVGQTIQSLQERLKKHMSQLNDNTIFHRAMLEIGVGNFWIELIEEVEDKIANEREFYWIKYYYKQGKAYNEKISLGKCGGDTLTNHFNIEEISQKLSASKQKSKNPNSVPIIAYNVKNGAKILYWSFKECQEALNIPRHDIIGRRCRGKITKPYNEEWMFKYVN